MNTVHDNWDHSHLKANCCQLISKTEGKKAFANSITDYHSPLAWCRFWSVEITSRLLMLYVVLKVLIIYYWSLSINYFPHRPLRGIYIYWYQHFNLWKYCGAGWLARAFSTLHQTHSDFPETWRPWDLGLLPTNTKLQQCRLWHKMLQPHWKDSQEIWRLGVKALVAQSCPTLQPHGL